MPHVSGTEKASRSHRLDTGDATDWVEVEAFHPIAPEQSAQVEHVPRNMEFSKDLVNTLPLPRSPPSPSPP